MAAYPYNTKAWQRLRRAHLALEPLCRDCLEQSGRTVPATDVDHLDPPRFGGDPFPSHDRLRSRCHPCHSRKTARGAEAGAVRSDRPTKGGDINGMPTDPDHPWNAGRPRGASIPTAAQAADRRPPIVFVQTQESLDD